MKKEYIYDLISFTVVLGFVFGIFYIMLFNDMPDVHISYSTKECVEVVNYGDTNYTCENYPQKYNHVWVQ